MTEKRKTGRPSLYTPELAAKVIAHMADGFSLTAAAGLIGVSRETVYTWAEKDQGFADALNLGRAMRLAFWERKHMEGTLPPASTIFALKQFSVEWREKVEIAGDKDNPLKVEHGASAALIAILDQIAKRREP